jgi:DNA-binding XRE family transcriptional regulator
MKAHELLIEFFRERGIKNNVFAEKIGTSTCTLFNILKKGHVPNISLAYEIEKKTNGRVTLYDWIDQSITSPRGDTEKNNRQK